MKEAVAYGMDAIERLRIYIKTWRRVVDIFISSQSHNCDLLGENGLSSVCVHV